jgi:hypothetical protein
LDGDDDDEDDDEDDEEGAPVAGRDCVGLIKR